MASSTQETNEAMLAEVKEHAEAFMTIINDPSVMALERGRRLVKYAADLISDPETPAVHKARAYAIQAPSLPVEAFETRENLTAFVSKAKLKLETAEQHFTVAKDEAIDDKAYGQQLQITENVLEPAWDQVKKYEDNLESYLKAATREHTATAEEKMATLREYGEDFKKTLAQIPFESKGAFLQRGIDYSFKLLADPNTPPLYRSRSHCIIAAGYFSAKGSDEFDLAEAERHMIAAVQEMQKANEVATDDPDNSSLIEAGEARIERVYELLRKRRERKSAAKDQESGTKTANATSKSQIARFAE